MLIWAVLAMAAVTFLYLLRRDAILVALMHSWNGFKLPLAPEQLHE